MHAAATRVRSVWKMHLQRSTLDRLREARLQLFITSTIVLQAFVRFKIHRLKYLDFRAAAVLVQGFYRASLARREHALLVKHRSTVLAERTDAGTDESMATVGCNTIPRGLVRRCTRCV
jgi:hypothetical protein